jgi:CheY-like chemotaxis protein
VSLLILVVDDEPDVELLFRQQFRRDLRAGRFDMEFAQSAPAALQRITDAGDNFAVDGELTIGGITHPVTLDAEFGGLDATMGLGCVRVMSCGTKPAEPIAGVPALTGWLGVGL